MQNRIFGVQLAANVWFHGRPSSFASPNFFGFAYVHSKIAKHTLKSNKNRISANFPYLQLTFVYLILMKSPK